MYSSDATSPSFSVRPSDALAKVIGALAALATWPNASVATSAAINGPATRNRRLRPTYLVRIPASSVDDLADSLLRQESLCLPRMGIRADTHFATQPR